MYKWVRQKSLKIFFSTQDPRRQFPKRYETILNMNYCQYNLKQKQKVKLKQHNLSQQTVS